MYVIDSLTTGLHAALLPDLVEGVTLKKRFLCTKTLAKLWQTRFTLQTGPRYSGDIIMVCTALKSDFSI